MENLFHYVVKFDLAFIASSLIFGLLYYGGLFKFLWHNICLICKHTLLILQFRASLLLCVKQTRSIPSIVSFIREDSYNKFAFVFRLLFSFVFLGSRVIYRNPVLLILLQAYFVIYLIYLKGIPLFYILFIVTESISGNLAMKYINHFSEGEFVSFIGGEVTLLFFSYPTLKKFYKHNVK